MKHKKLYSGVRVLTAGLMLMLLLLMAASPKISADTSTTCPDGVKVIRSIDQTVDEACKDHQKKTGFTLGDSKAEHQCGSGSEAVKTTINFGCKGESCLTSQPDTTYCSGDNSAILDTTFAIIRFLSYGVGLIVVASIVYAGIQYTTSQGDPKATAQAQTRIRSSIAALLIYIFAYAILNYVLPKGFLK